MAREDAMVSVSAERERDRVSACQAAQGKKRSASQTNLLPRSR